MERIKVLGAGTFGTVTLEKDTATGEKYVVKRMTYNKYQTPESIMREVIVVKYIEPVCRDYFLCYDSYSMGPVGARLVTKYVEGSYELFSYLSENKLRLLEKLFIMQDLAIGLFKLHSMGVAHRDIKAENVLYIPKRGLRCKFIDYGLACMEPEIYTIFTESQMIGLPDEYYDNNLICYQGSMGTSYYMAPELVRNEVKDFIGLFPVDVWALGVLFYLIAFSAYPVTGNNVMQIMYRIASLTKPVQLPDNTSDRDKQIFGYILSLMLVVNPRNRINARGLVGLLQNTIENVIKFLAKKDVPVGRARHLVTEEIEVNPNTPYMTETVDFRSMTITSDEMMKDVRSKTVGHKLKNLPRLDINGKPIRFEDLPTMNTDYGMADSNVSMADRTRDSTVSNVSMADRSGMEDSVGSLLRGIEGMEIQESPDEGDEINEQPTPKRHRSPSFDTQLSTPSPKRWKEFFPDE